MDYRCDSSHFKLYQIEYMLIQDIKKLIDRRIYQLYNNPTNTNQIKIKELKRFWKEINNDNKINSLSKPCSTNME